MKRRESVGYSLLAALIADLAVAAACELFSPPAGPHHWWGFLGFALLMLVGVLPAWLLFALLVLLLHPPKDWRGVLLFFLGCYTGPCVLLARVDPASLLRPWALPFLTEPILRIASAISVLMTLLYFGFSELGTRRRIQAADYAR